MQSKDLFSLIKEFPHTLSIFLTFTLDNAVIQKIKESSNGRTIIIHDSEQGVNLEENYESRLICIPAILNNLGTNCFHTKLAILKGEDRFRILIGSMNLTKPSFSSREEMCLQKDIYPGTVFFEQLIQFLSSINYPKAINLDFINEIIPIQNQKNIAEEPEIKFIYNDYEFSICDKIIREIKNLPKNTVIKIASPFLGTDLPSTFDDFIEKLKPKKIELYTRSSNKIPKKIKDLGPKVKLFEPDKRYSKFGFHAKIIVIGNNNNLFVYVGSANFTKQGFFSSLKNFGNQECGVVFYVNDPIEIKQINEWFNKGWMKPCTPDKWLETDKPKDRTEDFSKKPYAFAIREKKGVSIEIFIPKYENISVNATINSKKYVLAKNSDNFYSILVKNIDDKTENLIIKILYHDIIKIKIFDPAEYDKWKKYDGDSLFSYLDSPLESTDSKKLAISIKNKGIKAGNGNYTIIEPPLLEQFYLNVRRESGFILRKKIFTKSHLSELEKILEVQGGGAGIYTILQFIKAFTNVEKKHQIILSEFKNKCRSRLTICLDEMHENEKKFNRFMNHWIKSSAN